MGNKNAKIHPVAIAINGNHTPTMKHPNFLLDTFVKNPTKTSKLSINKTVKYTTIYNLQNPTAIKIAFK